MKQIAFLTMEDPGEFWVYDHLVHEPLRQRGIETHDIPWNRADVDWNGFELIEPSLYFPYDDQAAGRMATAIASLLVTG
jgi:hypothetical protein